MPEPAAEKSIFLHAAGLDSPADRAAYLDAACGPDSAVRARLDALLAAHDRLGADSPPTAGPDSTVAAPGPAAGVMLGGRFKLLEVIGEGGMGSVWLAEQTEPVRRLVALKVIKAGMDSKGVLARFEAERQALALMDHPNIAKVLDGGLTPDERPFFVMELVKGVPITRYCDDHHLTPRERLELFVPVCQAVQHAHLKGVIHRDLKPSNVLVAPYDGRPVPKVIDFGVAKAAGQPLTEKTLYTGLGAVVGTPEYMSPEQAELNNRDIDTRSDVYALGVLLYELLTGSTPFSKRDLEKAGMLEMLRVIREQEPSKPSTKLSAAAGLPTLAANRGTEPARLTRLVRGELDWIVMKALEKDRNRRYETANGFAQDVQRYLADETVQACPPSVGYRMRKFTRRHRVAVAFTAVVSAAVLFALVGLAVATVLISGEKEKKAAAYEQARINEEAANEQRALADTRKELAEKNAAAAAEQRGIAQANERLAKASERLERRRFYASQTNLAMQAWRGGDRPRTLELLEGLRGASPEDDLRGFDWYYLWGLCQGGKRQFLRGHTRAVMNLAYSPDGKTLASASWDGTVRLWDVETGKTRQILRHTSVVWYVAYSPDGRRLASSCAESLIVWDAETGKPLHTIPVMSRGLVFTADSKRLLAGVLPELSDVKPVPHQTRVWDVETGKQQLALEGSGIPMGLHPDGKTLLVLGNLFTDVCEIQLWDLAKGTKQRTIPADRGTHNVVFSPDGTRLANQVWSVVHQTEYPGGKRVGNPLGHVTSVVGLAYSPDGRFLACGEQGHIVAVWDVTVEKRLFQDQHSGPVRAVAFSPDGKTLASACADTGLIKLWDVAPTTEATSIVNPPPTEKGLRPVSYLRFTPDSKTLLYGDGNGGIPDVPPAGRPPPANGPRAGGGSFHCIADRAQLPGDDHGPLLHALEPHSPVFVPARRPRCPGRRRPGRDDRRNPRHCWRQL